MSLNKIMKVFFRDVKSGFRDYLIVVMILVPLLITVGFKMFLPNVNQASLSFAVDATVESPLVEHLEEYGLVQEYGKEELYKRVNRVDEVIGIVKENGAYKIILEGTERADVERLVSMILDKYVAGDAAVVEAKLNTVGAKESPMKLYGTIFLVIFAVMINGMIVGLNIIEEKESKTISSIFAAPLTKLEFILGKGILGFVLSIVETYFILWYMEYPEHLGFPTLLMAIAATLSGLIIGYIIGLNSSNQIAGIAIMKIVFLPLTFSVIGAIMLKESLQFLFYWSPFYWVYVGFEKILGGTGTFGGIIIDSTLVIGLCLLTMVIMKRKIVSGLSAE